MQTIYLDISNKGVIPCINTKQGEVGRKFQAIITDAGVPYVIPDNALLSVWYSGNTDEGNYSSIADRSAFAVAGNKVTVELVSQMLLKPGDGNLCLTVSGGEGTEISTWNIPYHVEFKPGAGSSVPTVYYTAFSEAAALAARSVSDAQTAAEEAKQAASSIFSLMYPVGSIYMSVNAGNPAELFGGTWEQIKDTFLLAAGAKYAAGSTGGEAEHTLTIAEIPEHNHRAVIMLNTEGAIEPNGATILYGIGSTSYLGEQYDEVTGDGQAHNNMPPYLAVYVWKRTA